jgi:4-amino-4-deoxy-L-arabinose transferase-like glycosyltransferase
MPVYSTMNQPLPRPAKDSDHVQAVAKVLRMLVLAFVGLRLVYAGMVQLLPDEATYWVWSRHPAAGYFDHPPMVAYLIRAGTYLLGNNELGVRLSAVLLATGSVLVMLAIARRILRDERAAMWVALIWLSSPLLAGIGTITTPDTPSIFFSVCGLAFALRAVEDSDALSLRDWLLFGVFCGLALLSKYTAILLPAAVFLALVSSPSGRKHLRRPGIYLAAIVALIIFSPVIWWNYKHQWASFAFQLHHGTESEEGAELPVSQVGRVGQLFTDVGVYVGGQAGAWTPVLFIVSLVVLAVYWRRYRKLNDVDRVLLWSGTVPLVFFGVMFAKSHHGEANWPAFAYFPISLLVVRWLSETWDKRRLGALKLGVVVAFGILIVMHALMAPKVTASLARLPYRVPHMFRDAVVWRDRGRVIGQKAFEVGLPMFANRHEDAAETAFYAPGQPEVWCVGIGSRPTAYDYFDDQPDFGKIPGVLWIGGHVDLFEQKYGFVEQSRTNLTFFTGRNQTSLRTYVLVRPQR